MKKGGNELMQFLAGLVMLIAGLFFFSQKVVVYSGYFGGFGYFWGGFGATSGLIVIPLIAGIVWMFVSGGKLPSKILTGAGAFLILASVIATTHIVLTMMTLFDWIILLVLIFGGAGFLIKVLLANRKEDTSASSERTVMAGKQEKSRMDTADAKSGTKAADSDDVDRELQEMKEELRRKNEEIEK